VVYRGEMWHTYLGRCQVVQHSLRRHSGLVVDKIVTAVGRGPNSAKEWNKGHWSE
jgi:hypothetical protein